MRVYRFLVMAVGVTGLLGQTKVDLNTQSRAVDFTGAALTKPARSSASLPGTCTAGEMFFLNGAGMYYCPTNSWVKLETISGTPASGDCARFDANGDVVDGGAMCGGLPNFQQSFTSATSVTLNHNLNSTGVVFTCFDNSTPPLWILPKSVAMTNSNTLTVTFASSQSGSCVVNANGGGTTPTFLSASSSLSFAAISQAACAQLTFTLTGANAGDVVAPGWPPALESGLAGSMIVTAANTVTVRLCNLSGATLTPAAETFKATVMH